MGLLCIQIWYLGQMKVSSLKRCPQFKGVHIEKFHLQYCVHKLLSTVPRDLSERLKAVILGGTFLIVSHCNYR